jgi:hypothetical protein
VVRARCWSWGAATAALLAAAVAWGGPAGSAALQATSEATAGPPAPEECLVEPRSVPLYSAPPLGTVTPAPEDPTPFAVPDGEPVDEATVEAIEATVRESVACRNAGDFLRAYALFTDRFVANLLGPPDAVDPDLVARLSVPPTPLPERRQLSVGSVSEVRRLADGRVGAIVVTEDRRERYADYLYFVQEGDRWLIDERVFLADTDVATPRS